MSTRRKTGEDGAKSGKGSERQRKDKGEVEGHRDELLKVCKPIHQRAQTSAPIVHPRYNFCTTRFYRALAACIQYSSADCYVTDASLCRYPPECSSSMQEFLVSAGERFMSHLRWILSIHTIMSPAPLWGLSIFSSMTADNKGLTSRTIKIPTKVFRGNQLYLLHRIAAAVIKLLCPSDRST